MFGPGKGRAEATHGGWKVTVEGFATNQEAENFATYLVTRFTDLGADKIVSVLKEDGRIDEGL